MSRGSGPRKFRLRRSVLAISLCLAVSILTSGQWSYAADPAANTAETTAAIETSTDTSASAETSSGGTPATKDAVADIEPPEVDQLLGQDSSSPANVNDGLTGSVTTTETAMATPPKIPSAAAKPASPASKLPPMAQVKLQYKQGKYFDALKVLATIKPTELTHYYAGLCYQGQGQLQKAAAEFGYVASIAKDPLVRYNANAALQSVSSYARSRTYAGQGNAFARAPSGGGGRAGGGAVRRG